jgi:hypothetical protein
MDPPLGGSSGPGKGFADTFGAPFILPDEPDADPADLMETQRSFNAAQTAVVAASRKPGQVSDWPEQDIEELHRNRAAELAAVKELTAARARTGSAPTRRPGSCRTRSASRTRGRRSTAAPAYTTPRGCQART